MLELFLIIIFIVYGRGKAYTDALRDYKEQMKLWTKVFNESSYRKLWVKGGSDWDDVRKCKLPVICADAWHYYDGMKFIFLSLQLLLGWLTANGYLHSFLPHTLWAVAWFVVYVWIGWWIVGLTFALYYHNWLIDPIQKSHPNVRYYSILFLIINSIRFWNPLPSKVL